jgi:calcineurin-like phosphoesterase family protein
MAIFFTADCHFGHRNILKYSNRPFADIQEHDEQLISRWNEKVSPRDIVYMLGDLAFHTPETAYEIFKRLNGKKCWVLGGHDNPQLVRHCMPLFEWVRELTEITVQDRDAPRGLQRIVLCHYAMRTWNRAHYGAWQLYGHSHGHMPDDPMLLAIDVGVDCHNYAPISYTDVKNIMYHKEWTPPAYLSERNA